MNTLISSSLISIELLADRNRAPCALLLGCAPGAADALASLSEQPDFRALSSRLPCLMPDTGDQALAAALQAAGCQLVSEQTEPQAIFRTDCLPEQALAPAVRWIAGPWYLAPPAKVSGSQAASRALALQLVQLVCADADTHEIEAVLRRDPALSYHLLRLVNSLGMGLSKKITSFAQALLILGRAQLRRWLNLMLFSARQGDQRSAMLLARVAVRARSMELLAKACGMDKSGQELAFMAGMFSLLGVLFGLPLAEVLQPLKISDALLAAMLRHEGELGRMLALVEKAEQGELAALAPLLDALQVAPDEFNLLTARAYGWMLDVVRDSSGGTRA